MGGAGSRSTAAGCGWEGFGRVAERGGRIFKDARLAAAFGDVLRQQFAADGENVLAARGMPIALTCSSMKGSSSSTTMTLRTPSANSRISFFGGGSTSELEDGGFGKTCFTYS